MKHARSLLLVSLLAAGTAWAQQPATVLPADTTASFVVAQKGKRVTLRLASGQELTGVVREATDRLVVLGEVTGREFFDAVVPTHAIEAVLVRNRP